MWPGSSTYGCHSYTNHLQAAKTTTASLRVIAAATSSYDLATGTYTLEDTASLTYSGGRGSSFNFYNGWTLKFDVLTGYSHGTLLPDTRNLQTFDAGGNILSSIQTQWYGWLSAWRNDSKTEFTYDAAGNVLSLRSFTWDTVAATWQNSYERISSYNSSNKLTTELTLGWNTSSSAWDSSSFTTYSYDASGRESALVVQVMTSGIWDNYNKITHDYDAAGNAITDAYLVWDIASGTWQYQSRIGRTFDGAHHRLTDTSNHYSTTPPTWTPEYVTVYSSYSGDNPGIASYGSWNTSSMSFQFSNQDSLVYNSSAQPESYWGRTWDAPTLSWKAADGDFATHYYYESYELTVDLRPGADADVLLAPLPANHQLNVALTWAQPQAFTITVCDMLGKILYSEPVGECYSFKGHVPVNTLPAGNYIIKFVGPLQQCTRIMSVAH